MHAQRGSLFSHMLWSLASGALVCLTLLGLIYYYLNKQLPDVDVLKDVHLQVPLRIYTQDEQLIAEYGHKRRHPVQLSSVPPVLIQAFLAAEDQRFYQHAGIDVLSLIRATLSLLKTGRKSQGASTITMQVARNFFLSRKKTYMRKVNEILLAIKIDQELSKDKILELYLNKIYLGQSAYGVAAAAQIYYGRELGTLTLSQLAMIAALPKAPSRVNPINNPEQALHRRNYVLARMLEENFIDETAYQAAIDAPITAQRHRASTTLDAPHVAETIRQLLFDHFGEAAYSRGLSVYTTIDSSQQIAAQQALRQGLLAYERRHGYRGPLDHDGTDAWRDRTTYPPMQIAKVIRFDGLTTQAELTDGTLIEIPWQQLKWARPAQPHGRRGSAPTQPQAVLEIGDIIEVEYEQSTWRLTQSPEIEGALVSMDVQTGAIRAMVGGYHYQRSEYNRVTQAKRQPGSCFKPFIYAAGLAKGYTLATLLNDAPVVKQDHSLADDYWRPKNHNAQFQGPTRLSLGLTRSRNLVSIRLLERMGIKHALDYVTRFGFDKADLPASLSIALGSASVTPLELTRGFSVLANGGFRVIPHLIDRIVDIQGDTVLKQHPPQACPSCIKDPEEPHPENTAPQVIEPAVAYLINKALKDGVQMGPAPIKGLKRHDLSGKTGSTNDHSDAWFVGYNGRLVATVWLGFDAPRSTYEYGIRAARPIWIDFMREALRDQPEATMPEPPGLVRLRIDPTTGLLAKSDQKDSFLEVFRQEYAPTQSSYRNEEPSPSPTTLIPEDHLYLF